MGGKNPEAGGKTAAERALVESGGRPHGIGG